MQKEEFEALAGVKVTDEMYYKVIEPMYLATSLKKQEFVKLIDVKAVATTEVKPKLIKRMCIRDHSGCKMTPNGCYYHIKYVELVDIEVSAGKYIVKELDQEELNKLVEHGFDLRLAYDYYFDYSDCIDMKGKPIYIQ